MKVFPLLLLAALLSGCTSNLPLRLNRAEFGSPIWGDAQQRAGILFQDGSQSISAPGGTLWTFGDSFVGKPPPGQPPQNSQITGCLWATMAWLPAGKTNLPPELEYLTDSNGFALCPLQLFPDEDQKHLRLWPLNGIAIGSRVYLYYAMIKTGDKGGPWDFRSVGSGLAVSDALPPACSQFTRLRPNGRAEFPVSPIQILPHGHWLYLYEVSGAPKGLILARVAARQIENPAAYQFFTGNGWSADRARAKLILREAYGQVSIAWLPPYRQYIMATSSDFSHPHEIQLRTSRDPQGPWSPPLRIAVPEMPGKETQVVYCTFLHPELSDLNNLRLVMTFCRILKGNWQLSNPESVIVQLAAP